MKNSELKKLIREMLLQEAVEPSLQENKIEGQIKYDLLKKLIPDFDTSKFSTALNLVKQGKALNMDGNKILADVMIAMIKTKDDGLLNQIFANLKSIEAK